MIKKVNKSEHQSHRCNTQNGPGGIAEQISAAVGTLAADKELLAKEQFAGNTDLLANKEFIESDREKSILLDLSNAITTIRTREELCRLADEKLRKVVYVTHVSFCCLGPDGKTFYLLSADPASICATHPEYASITKSAQQVNDDVVNKVLLSEHPLVVDMATVMRNNGAASNFIRMLYEVGIKQVIFVTLRYRNEPIGFLAISRISKVSTDSNQLDLVKGIASQLSVALTCIKANEKIEQQLAEIGKSETELQEQGHYFQQEMNSVFANIEIIGKSQPIKDVFKDISLISRTDISVLVLGETGTGKDLVAHAIHNTSPHKNKPLIKLDCAALPPQLIESELFGHERGAFTGAFDKRIGKFEIANGSTLFLDEIGELPLELQAKLLRVVQEKELERLGSNRVIHVDVRIIAATNRDLETEVRQGRFRSDLYFRLNVFPIRLPSLRERTEDIPLLAAHFIKKVAKKLGWQIKGITDKVIKELQAYHWPGNIRELEHVIERSSILCPGKVIQEIRLPAAANNPVSETSKSYKMKSLEEHEKEYILDVLQECKGKISGINGAAQILAMPPTTLESRMRKLGIKRKFC